MPGFDFICPMNYPNRCDLAQTEVDYLQKDEGKKAGFLMYQFSGQDDFLVDAVKSYFEPRNCRILDASKEPASGVKICKICRLATASHFGIAVLSPENYNVYMEVGLVLGQGKPILFCVNEERLQDGKKLSDIAFDLSSHMVIKYSSQSEFEEGLIREASIFMEKVRVMGLFQQALVASIRTRIQQLKSMGVDRIDFLRMLLLVGREEFGVRFLDTYIRITYGSGHDFKSNYHKKMEELAAYGFLEIIRITPPTKESVRYHLSKELLPILRQEAFKEIE
jgi:hypothetical protein